MAPRATWKGHIKLSLVSFPVKLFNAVSSASRIALNQLHKDCNHRLKQQMVCPEHGAVERDEIVKGYEFEKGKYVVVDESDLEKVKLDAQKTIELTHFIDSADLDPLFLDSPYYVAPDSPMGEEAFRVVREAMRNGDKVAIGRVVMSGREHAVALQVLEQGFLLSTLRSASEVRGAQPYFEDIRQVDVSKDQLALATQLIESHAGEFTPSDITDRYQDALMAVIKAKLAGAEPAIVQQEEVGQVINLMDALKQSVVASAAAAQKKPPAKSIKAASAKRARAKGA